LFEEEFKENQCGFLALKQKLVDEMKIKQSELNQMMARYPPILSKSLSDLDRIYADLGEYGITKEEISSYLIKCPRLVSFDLKHRMEEMIFTFQIYNKLTKKDVVDIVKAFPYALTITPLRIKEFAG
jgi:hypothetical protein